MRVLPIGPTMVLAPPDLPAGVAARMLARAPQDVIVVTTEDGHPLGLLTSAQIIDEVGVGGTKAIHPAVLGAYLMRATGWCLRDVMASDTAVPLSATRAEIAARFLRSGMTHLAAVDDRGSLVGIFVRDGFVSSVRENTRAAGLRR